MKKKLSVVMLVTIFVVSAFSSTAYSQASQPLAADGGALDFYINSWDRGLTIDYCNEYIIAYAKVYSPSNSTPDVKAEVNGVNFTMSAPLFLTNGGLNNKFFAAGITFYAYIQNPRVGQYNLTIHAGNSSGYAASTMLQTQYNKTWAIQSLSNNGTSDVNQIGCFKYFFNLDESISTYECVTSVTVNINGTVYTMLYANENIPMIGNIQYYYIHDFGTQEANGSATYNFTIHTTSGSYFVPGGVIDLYKPVAESSLDIYSPGSNVLGDMIEKTPIIQYFDGLNRAPQLLISINGTNQSVSYKHIYEFLLTNIPDMIDFLYCQYDNFLLGGKGEILILDTLKFEYGKYYNVSLWWSNGSDWNEVIMYTNQLISPMVHNITEPTILISETSATLDGDKMVVKATITVTSNVDNFQLKDNEEIEVSIWSPERQTTDWADELDPLDTNFNDGKVYKLNATIWADSREFWGNVLINATIKYGNDSLSVNVPFNKMYATASISRTAGVEGEYKLKTGDVLTYIYNVKYKQCCTEMVESSTKYKYNFTKVAYENGSDIFEYEMSVIFDSIMYNDTQEQLISSEKKGMNVALSAKTLYGKIENVMPLNDGVMDKFVEYMNDFPLDVSIATVSTAALTGLTTIAYNETIGEFEFKISIVYDKNGVYRSRTVQHYLSGELIYEMSVIREMSFVDMIFLDYLWYAVIGVVALVAIVVIVMKMKK
jgi:hypothetical protein